MRLLESELGAALAPSVAQASGLMLAAPTCESLLALLTSTAAQAVDVATGAVVSLTGPDGAWITIGATGVAVERAEHLQAELGEGPSHAALAQRHLVAVADCPRDLRWPRWSAAVRELGVGSAISTPLVAGDAVVGTMSLYAPRPRALSERHGAVLALFAAQAAVLATSARAATVAAYLPERVVGALRSRDDVNRAVGFLMGKEGVSEEAALLELTALARQEHRGVPETAARLLRARRRGRSADAARR